MPATKVTGPPIILIRVAPALREHQEPHESTRTRSSARGSSPSARVWSSRRQRVGVAVDGAR